jgi:hypothetical protein
VNDGGEDEVLEMDGGAMERVMRTPSANMAVAMANLE